MAATRQAAIDSCGQAGRPLRHAVRGSGGLAPSGVMRLGRPWCAYAAQMANKQPRSSEKKKVGKNLKEKRNAKNEKKIASQSLGRTSDK